MFDCFPNADPPVIFRQVTLNDLDADLPPGTFHPPFELEYGDNWMNACQVADIPLNLFNEIAPCFDDLPWLGHVREIQPGNTQSAKYINKLKSVSTATSSPKLSTVICNRLPIAGAQSTACLVSFENWGKYLPDQNGGESSEIPAGTTTIRILLLKQWQFYAVTQEETFSGYLLNLNKQDGKFEGALLQLRLLEKVLNPV